MFSIHLLDLCINLLEIPYQHCNCLFGVICVQKIKRLFSSSCLDLTNYTNYLVLKNHSDSGFMLVPPNINSVCNPEKKTSKKGCEIIGLIFGPKLRICLSKIF